jgi:putative transposase
MTRNKQAIEVVTVNQERRRRWSAEEKAALVRETYEPDMNVSLVARKHGVGASQLFNWRKLEREGGANGGHGWRIGGTGERTGRCARANSTVAAHAWQENDGGGNPEGGRRVRSRKIVDCALALVGQGRPVKPVCSVFGVARSHVAQLLVRPADWIDGHTTQAFHQPADAILVDAVRAEITALPTYGYRRAGALVNRTRALMGLPAINQS